MIRLTATARPLLSGCFLAMILALSTGCDRSDTKDSSTSSHTGSPYPPTPDNTPPAPEPVEPDTLPHDPDGLNVAAAFPGPGEPRVALVSSITVEFDADLMQGLDLANTISVQAPTGEVAGSITQTAPDTLVFRPHNLWSAATVYSIAVDPDVMSADGSSATAGIGWQFTTVADVYTTPQAVIDACMSDLDVEMLAAVNQARVVARNCGSAARPAVGKLVWNCRLQQAAITHSEDMATHDFFEHAGSDGSSASDRVSRTGYAWSYVGENLAAGQRTVTEVINGLLDSPGHCDNIMSPHFTEFGFGYRFNNDTYYKRYWTQNFARPRG